MTSPSRRARHLAWLRLRRGRRGEAARPGRRRLAVLNRAAVADDQRGQPRGVGRRIGNRLQEGAGEADLGPDPWGRRVVRGLRVDDAEEVAAGGAQPALDQRGESPQACWRRSERAAPGRSPGAAQASGWSQRSRNEAAAGGCRRPRGRRRRCRPWAARPGPPGTRRGPPGRSGRPLVGAVLRPGRGDGEKDDEEPGEGRGALTLLPRGESGRRPDQVGASHGLRGPLIRPCGAPSPRGRREQRRRCCRPFSLGERWPEAG